MIFNDSKFYQRMSKSLDSVSREIRQNVPHLKIQDDIAKKSGGFKIHAFIENEAFTFTWREDFFGPDLIIGSGFKKGEGYTFLTNELVEKFNSTDKAAYVNQQNAYKRLMEDKL
jgi:hypothetical protein